MRLPPVRCDISGCDAALQVFFFSVAELSSLRLQLHLIRPHATGTVEEKNHIQRKTERECGTQTTARKNALADIQILICL